METDRWQKIEHLYHSALERKAGERSAYLQQACQGDDALLQEVQSLLAHEQPTDALFEKAVTELVAKVPANSEAVAGRLLIGRQLGNYQLHSLLGAGGMGEVYEARDTKLGRKVAIKVLPAAFSHDPERLSRFQREARLLASLNHPNISSIYGLEDTGGARALVMELVEGPTLADRIKSGPLPVDESLRIALQITEALEYAHERGIVHRDLKPANVKVTPSGRVKVLDFGLAKALTGDTGVDLSQLPTVAANDTREGAILGTPAYMSPEQVRGKPVDKRADIWAFGCVLYELLTGRLAFPGDTLPDTIAAVLEKEPDWRALPPATPSVIRDVLRRCLQKSPRSRLHDIADARIHIDEALSARPNTEQVARERGTRALQTRTLLVSLATLLLGAAITALAIWNLKPLPPRPVSRTLINLPADQQLAGLENGPAVALSPDGTRLAYVARQGSTQQLYLRAMDSLDANPVPDTEGAVNPFFSPDGQALGFFAAGKLKKILVGGGAAIDLCDAAPPFGASWGSQGMIAFALTTNSVLLRAPDSGGTVQTVTRLENAEIGHRWPDFLPDGRTVLFAAETVPANWSNAQIAAQSLGTSKRLNLVASGTQPRYVPSGYLVYARAGTLMAVPFNAQRLTATGTPVPVIEGILQSPVTGAAQYSFSASGSLVYVPSSNFLTQSQLVWVDRNGAEQPVQAPAHNYVGPRISPDGKRVAIDIDEASNQTWVYDLGRNTLTRLTFQAGANIDPLWTPDGKRIVFKGAGNRLFWQPADGSGGSEPMTSRELTGNNVPGSWSPDGQVLAFMGSNPKTGNDLYTLSLPDGKPQPFVRGPSNETAPRFSPDGRFIAYASDESGRFEIYVRPYPGPGGKWQISTEGGTEPVWNPKGGELFYRSGDQMMAVDVTTQPLFLRRQAKKAVRRSLRPHSKKISRL